MRRLFALLVIILCAAAPSGRAPAAEQPQTPARDASLVVQLVRDRTVQSELDLTPDQKKSVAALVADVEYPLFLLRDAAADQHRDKREALATRVESGLREALAAPQRQRLAELLLRAQGYPALVAPPHSDVLGLSKPQADQISKLLAAAQKAKAGTAAANVDKQVLGVLTSDQSGKLSQMVGGPFDLSRIRIVACLAPELRDVERWINTDPLTFSGLKGRVVAVHFWAFGCINCVHNLPHYQDWQTRFADRGLTILGIHTPETQAERSLESLAQQVKSRDIAYPVAADAKSTNWAAWANNLWPSVYLVDKQGYVRYWWYGELNWQGAEGEALMRKRIGELLAEKGS